MAAEVNTMLEIEVGVVDDFFAKPVVAGVRLSGRMKIGDRIRIVGHTTDLLMTVESMQIDNKPVSEADTGQSVGIKVADRVRSGDKVYLITE